jgi:hypothetical protein
MTNPFAVNPGGVVQGIGPGPVMGQGIADVLAQMQIGKENQFRQQELQNQMMQQQALQQYYQAQAQAEQQRIAAEAQENLYKREGLAQRGRAVQNYMGGQPGVVQPGQSTMPQQDSGNIFRDLTAGGSAAIGGQQGYDRLFNGVAPENVPDALGDLKNAQDLLPQAPKPPELPTSAKEMQFMQHLQQADPSGASAKFFYENWVKKQPGVVVNTGDAKAESAYAVETAKSDVAVQAESIKQANLAAKSFPAMSEAYKLVPRSITGFGAQQVLTLARIAGAVGFKPSNDAAADTQTLGKLMGNNVLAKLQTRALGSNTAVSEGDRIFMERNAGYDITLTPQAIKRIIRIEMGLNLETMLSAKLELQQAFKDRVESRGVIQGKIDLIDKKFNPLWNEYWKVMSQEQKEESGSAGDVVNSLFPAR